MDVAPVNVRVTQIQEGILGIVDTGITLVLLRVIAQRQEQYVSRRPMPKHLLVGDVTLAMFKPFVQKTKAMKLQVKSKEIYEAQLFQELEQLSSDRKRYPAIAMAILNKSTWSGVRGICFRIIINSDPDYFFAVYASAIYSQSWSLDDRISILDACSRRKDKRFPELCSQIFFSKKSVALRAYSLEYLAHYYESFPDEELRKLLVVMIRHALVSKSIYLNSIGLTSLGKVRFEELKPLTDKFLNDNRKCYFGQSLSALTHEILANFMAFGSD